MEESAYSADLQPEKCLGNTLQNEKYQRNLRFCKQERKLKSHTHPQRKKRLILYKKFQTPFTDECIHNPYGGSSKKYSK